MASNLKTKDLPKRSEIPAKYRWKLTDIYSSDQAWEDDFLNLKKLIADIKAIDESFTDSAAKVLNVLQLKDNLGRLLDKLYVYARMHKDEDNTVALYQAMSDRIQSLASEASGALAFIIPALVNLPAGRLEEYMNQLPELQLYQHLFDEITRQKEHILSAAEERLLAEVGEVADAAGTIFSMFDNADLRFPTIVDENGEEVELTKGRYSRFLESKDQRVRRDAFQALYHTYDQYRNTLASTLSSSVKADVFYAKARKFDSALAASLDSDNIAVSVYDRLIEVVHNFLPSLQRYLKLRKRMLNLPEIHMYDLYTPLIPEYQRNIPYEEAKELVLDSLAPLGDDYQLLAQTGLDNGWVDVYETEGKTSGAYAWGAYNTHPYILLNYQEKINDVFTLAHEMGHALHSYYSNKHQPYVYASYKIFLAEVASTVNEALLMEYLTAKSTEKNEKLYLINQRLEQFRTTVFRQTMFAEFEKLIHSEVENGGALTADWLCEKYFELNKLYYGSETIIDGEIAMEWSRIPHFYTPFYVYKYATGYSAATAISQMLLNEGLQARVRYLEFLKSGDSDYPLNILNKAGVDMQSPKPVEDALTVFDKLIDQMLELTGIEL
ncbi:MAG TPA: oligoendopeptidase F [Bacillota bacterium]|nr:oligoendopeptidase F [Bacillota bacterium]HOL09319.1 oligoendopeptidase F [Bacillota bacterium]HPO97650.1 oligoendopeptidase F [Bacillota bacterium]